MSQRNGRPAKDARKDDREYFVPKPPYRDVLDSVMLGRNIRQHAGQDGIQVLCLDCMDQIYSCRMTECVRHENAQSFALWVQGQLIAAVKRHSCQYDQEDS